MNLYRFLATRGRIIVVGIHVFHFLSISSVNPKKQGQYYIKVVMQNAQRIHNKGLYSLLAWCAVHMYDVPNKLYEHTVS